MIPIPPELLELYPAPPDAPIPGRPWWRIKEHRGSLASLCYNTIRRVDGHTADDKADPELIAAFDRENPLPHPGFRVGQVWGYWQVNAPVVASIALQFGDQFLVFAADYPGSKYQHTMDSGRLHGCLAGWFLLADPCCPHLAPWAPAWEKP